MSRNHAREAVAFPDVSLGTCKHCNHRCAPNRRQHDSGAPCLTCGRACADVRREENDWRAVAKATEGQWQRCVDCRRYDGQRVRFDGELVEIRVERDHPRRIADNGPRRWTVARCQFCHRDKTARENSKDPRRQSDRRANRRNPVKISRNDIRKWALTALGLALVAAAMWWSKRPAPAPRRHGKSALPQLPSLESLADTVTLWAHRAIWIGLGALLLGALYMWARRVADARSEKLMFLSDAIGAITNTPPEHMKIKATRWERRQPVAGWARYSAHFDDRPGSRGCQEIEELLTRKIGRRLQFAWRPEDNIVEWQLATGGPDVVEGEVVEDRASEFAAKLAKMKERVEESLRAGIKGEVEVRWGKADAVGPLSFTVSYPSAFPDETPEARQTVVDRVNKKAPGRWRASWNTEENLVRFDRRPDMPTMIECPVPASSDAWRIPLGINEAHDEVAWDMKAAPHALVVGGTGSGKTVLLRSIISAATAKGFTVFCADPKRIELTGYRGYPGVSVVASTTEEMIALVTLLADEMDRRYTAIERGEITEADLPPVLMVVDEATEFINRVNAWWKVNKPKGASGTEHPVVERHRSMARLGRSGRIHLVTGIQRPDAKVFGGEARDNYGFRIALGKMSEQGARMVFGRADVARDDALSDFKGRATVATNDEVMEVQTYYTPNPRECTKVEAEHLARLADAARANTADAVPYISADTVAKYAGAMAEGAEDPAVQFAAVLAAADKARERYAIEAAPELDVEEPADGLPPFKLVTLDFLAREVKGNGTARIILDINGEDTVVTVETPPCPSQDDESEVELDFVGPDGKPDMILVDANEKIRRVSLA